MDRRFAGVTCLGLLGGCDLVFTLDPPATALERCVADEFDDNLIAGVFVAIPDPSFTVAEQGGRIEITVAPLFQGVGFGGVRSTATYDVNDAVVEIEVSEPGYQGPDDPGNVFAGIALQAGPTSYYEVLVIDSELVIEHAANDVVVEEIALPYVESEDRRWRFRHEADRMFFDTGPDGTSWTRRHDAPAAVPLDGVTIAIFAGSYSGGVRAPAPVAFDHFAIRHSDCSGF